METSSSPVPAGAATAYQAALRIAMNHSTTLWLMTLAYLPFGLVLAGWGAYPAITGSTIPILDTLISIVISAAGLGSTILWAGLTSRTLKQQRYWLLVARELESQVCPGSDYLRRAMTLDTGEAIIVSNERVRLEPLERPKSIGHFHVYYGLFLLIFVFLLIFNFLRFGRVL